MTLTKTKAETLAAIARHPSPIPEEMDWAIVLTPADPEESTEPTVIDGAASQVDPHTCSRIWIWAGGKDGLSDAASTLNSFRLSGLQELPENLKITVKVEFNGSAIEVPGEVFLKELLLAQIAANPQ